MNWSPSISLQHKDICTTGKEHLLNHVGYRHIEAEHFDKSSAFIELIAPDQDALFQIQGYLLDPL